MEFMNRLQAYHYARKLGIVKLFGFLIFTVCMFIIIPSAEASWEHLYPYTSGTSFYNGPDPGWDMTIFPEGSLANWMSVENCGGSACNSFLLYACEDDQDVCQVVFSG